MPGLDKSLLTLKGVSKRYPGVVANDRVDLQIKAGEIHALLGENGAGKTTLMKIANGVIEPDEGEIEWQGKSVSITSPADAARLGIAMVFQHFSLFESLTVTENIALALRYRGKREALQAQIAEVSAAHGLPVNPNALVHDLSIGDRQRVEITRCLLLEPKLLIMDEPTSVLTPQAVERLFDTLRGLAASGCGVLYISHKLKEIRALCDTATILRRGKVVGVADPQRESEAALAEKMIGAQFARAVAPSKPGIQAKHSGTALELKALTRTPNDENPHGLEAVSLTLQPGELLGIAGISGNGQQSLLRAISGEETLVSRGKKRMQQRASEVRLTGEAVGHLSVAKRRERGLGLVPEERLGRGLVPELSLAKNSLLTATHTHLVKKSWVQNVQLKAFAQRCIDKFSVACPGADTTARELSGGNAQKFILGREVLLEPKVLVLSQPTWGVDVGAATAIWQALLELKAQGMALLVISEELDELFAWCDQLAVMANGRLSPQVAVTQTSVAEIGQWMGGNFSPTKAA